MICFTLQLTPPRNVMTSTSFLVQSNLKAFVMLNCKELEFSLMGVSMAA